MCGHRLAGATALSLVLLALFFPLPATSYARHNDLFLLSHKQCPTGYELHYDRSVRKYECLCKKYHLYWPEDGLCYREYQQGPCPEGHR